MKITWPTAAVVLGLLAFLTAMFAMHVLTGPALAVSVTTTLVGALTRQLVTDTTTGGASLAPPPDSSVPPVEIPKHNPPRGLE